MEIVRTIERDGSFLPPAVHAIRKVPQGFWTHSAQRLLHPRTVYSRALSKVTLAWTEAFHQLDRVSAHLRFNEPITDSRLLEDRYTDLLYALNEHIEACYAVMRCLGPPPEGNGLWHHKVARGQKLIGLNTFEEQVIDGYRNVRLGAAVNLIKHDGARLRLLAMRSTLAFTIAYYVDGPLPSGAIGPSLRVHANGNSAFSFNRDMLLHWWWLYRSSELVSHVVEQAVVRKQWEQQPGSEGGTGQDPGAAENVIASNSKEFLALCRRIAEIRADFMPDEAKQPFPLVVFDELHGTMRISFPASRRANPVVGERRFTQLITLDDAGQAYKMPYMGRDADELTVEAS